MYQLRPGLKNNMKYFLKYPFWDFSPVAQESVYFFGLELLLDLLSKLKIKKKSEG